MIVICGKTCSGKTTLGKMLEKDFGFSKVKTFTTRPKREGEEDGKDYIFVDDEAFEAIRACNNFAETTEYFQPQLGRTFKYGTPIGPLRGGRHSKRYIILNPEGAKQLEEKGFEFDIFYVTGVDDSELEKRYLARGGTIEEFKTRITQDNKDFYRFGENINVRHNVTYISNKDGFSFSRSIIDKILIDLGYKKEKKDMSGYGKRTRADMWEEIQTLKDLNDHAVVYYDELKEQFDILDKDYHRLEKDYDKLEKKYNVVQQELSLRIKDLNDYIAKDTSKNNNNDRITFGQFRKIITSKNIDRINFYDVAQDYIFTISPHGYAKYINDATRNMLDSAAVINCRPIFENDSVILDLTLNIGAAVKEAQKNQTL